MHHPVHSGQGYVTLRASVQYQTIKTRMRSRASGDDLQYVACRVKITTNDLRHKRRLNQRLNVSINEFNVLPFGMKLKASLSI